MYKRQPDGHRPSGLAAKEGTAAHLLLSWILTCKELQQPVSIPRVILIEGVEFPVENDLLHRLAELVSLWRSADEVWSELSVTPFPTYKDICGGTADLVTWTWKTKTLHVCDLKYGRGFVNEIGNTQLLLYALGAIRHIGRAPEHIELSIFQPRAPGASLRTWSLSANELKDQLKPLLAALVKAQKEPESATAGSWCKWCAHQATCKTWRQTQDRLQQEVDQGIMDLNELGRLRKAFRSFADAVDERLKIHLREGHRLTTVKLVEGPGRRQWIMSSDDLQEKLIPLIRSLDPDDIMTLKSVAQIEKLLRANKKEEFSQFYIRGSGSQLLVDADDP